MRLVCLSDTHDCFRDLTVPDGDLLLHAGDLSRRGTLEEVRASTDWLRGLPHRHKVVIAGNHDFCLESPAGVELMHGLTYLVDESCVIEGVRIHGSPWSLAHGRWAYQAESLREQWERIPADTQVLLTHTPPLGILDRHHEGPALGCPDLRSRVREVRPWLHLVGHVHESYGWVTEGPTVFVNGSNCSLGYKYLQPALVFSVEGGEVRPERTLPQKGTVTAPVLLWEELVARHGHPVEVRYLPVEQQRWELTSGHVFFVEVVSDGYGSGEVAFRPARPGDDVLDRGPDHLHRRWAFTLGVPFAASWIPDLNANPWERYSEVPYLP